MFNFNYRGLGRPLWEDIWAKLEPGERESSAVIWRKRNRGKRQSKCKGAERRACLACCGVPGQRGQSRISKERRSQIMQSLVSTDLYSVGKHYSVVDFVCITTHPAFFPSLSQAMDQISQLATPPLLFFRPKESESTWFLQTYPIFFGSLSAYNKIEPWTELLLT